MTVSRDSVFVEYVAAYLPTDEDATHKNGKTRFSYSVKANITSVADDKPIPSEFALEQNYPNPFNPSTKIKYQIPVQSEVKLIVYDLLGRKVMVLVDKKQEPGSYEAEFDGSHLASGLYFYQLSSIGKTQNFVETKKMLLIK